MITFSRAQFSAFSSTRKADDLTALLGVAPSEQYERGEPKHPDNPNSSRFDVSIWTLIPPTGLNGDETGTGALRWVLAKLGGLGPVLSGLARDYDFDLSWWGTTASWNTAVSLPSDLLEQVAELGLNLDIDFKPANDKVGEGESGA